MSYATNVPVMLASTTLASAATSISFSSISSAYVNLTIYVYATYTGAVANDTMALRFNSDSSASYVNYSTSGMTALYAGWCLGTSAFTPGTIMTRIHVINYSSTSNKKYIQAVSKANTSTTVLMCDSAEYYGFWNNNSAITSFTLTSFSGYTFSAGSKVYVEAN